MIVLVNSVDSCAIGLLLDCCGRADDYYAASDYC